VSGRAQPVQASLNFAQVKEELRRILPCHGQCTGGEHDYRPPKLLDAALQWRAVDFRAPTSAIRATSRHGFVPSSWPPVTALAAVE
jgi:hypothetical protein